MMPINNFSNTKIKIYSTNKGIKIVDSPIKIQILNILEGQKSEMDIVKQTRKSKSTISVHLKNLVDEGILSYKSHPLDRRSKLFYVYANYIGEIYPDKIIYKLPAIESDISSQAQLYMEILRQFKSILLIHGLQIEPLEVATGQRIGEVIYDNFEYETIDELNELIISKFEELDLGNIKISSVDPLIIKNKGCHECFKLQYNISTCNVTKGILKGIFEGHFGKEINVEEVECTSKYDDCCTFTIDY